MVEAVAEYILFSSSSETLLDCNSFSILVHFQSRGPTFHMGRPDGCRALRPAPAAAPTSAVAVLLSAAALAASLIACQLVAC